MSDANPRSSYVVTLTRPQAARFRELLAAQNWEFGSLPYALWRAKRAKTTIVAYESGKCTIQGKETGDVVQFVLEPSVLKEARFGYESELAETETPEMFEPHAGIDESGKGDYFGPLVVAAAYVDPDSARELMQLGVRDSKAIKSDRKILGMVDEIRTITRGRFALVAIGPEAYNRLYDKFQNVNRLLAWGHARALENLLEKVPDCPRALSDQFGRKSTVLRALQERGRKIRLEQRPKAESDLAVAAASILARADFVRRLERLGEEVELELPKGASSRVREVAGDVVGKLGPEALGRFVKLHFRTTAQVLGESG